MLLAACRSLPTTDYNSTIRLLSNNDRVTQITKFISRSMLIKTVQNHTFVAVPCAIINQD